MQLLAALLCWPRRRLIAVDLLEHQRNTVRGDRRKRITVVLDRHARLVMVEAHQRDIVRAIDHHTFETDVCHASLLSIGNHVEPDWGNPVAEGCPTPRTASVDPLSGSAPARPDR